MILENFYTIIKKESVNQETFRFLIHVNKEHVIFQGHFPNNPVMPGVCMMQIIKELSEEIIGSKLFMQKCTNVKFMALINPEINNELQLDLRVLEENGQIKIQNKTKFDDTLALKMSAQYKILSKK